MKPTRRSPATKISAVVSDVDGTLVNENKLLTARAIAAVAALHARGINFTIVSSRPTRGLQMLLAPLQIKRPFGSFNGGMITTPDLLSVGERLLSPDVARRAIDMLDARGVQAWVFAGQEWFVRDVRGAHVAHEEHTVGFGPRVVADFGPFLDVCAKIVGATDDFDLLAQCEREVAAALAGQASATRSQLYYLDITHPLANKGVFLSEVAELMAVPLAEVAVIGDGGNDVMMFERSGLSIAMGNAAHEVQQAADFVTASNREDGFAQAIERFILSGDRARAPIEINGAGERRW
jgi:Cof subfamily protein (haloacid dehalogenase superfamily)